MEQEKIEKNRGRPTKYTAVMAAEVCRRHAAGETATSILDSVGVDWATWCDWLSYMPDLSKSWARASGEFNRRLVDEIAAPLRVERDDHNRPYTNVADSRLTRIERYLRLLSPHDYGNESERAVHADIDGLETATGAQKMSLISDALRKRKISRPTAELLIKLAEAQIKAEEVEAMRQQMQDQARQLADLQAKLSGAAQSIGVTHDDSSLDSSNDSHV